MMPKVSVVIPVYNTAPFLHRCLDSMIRQSLQDVEIICVDDGSTDDSIDILRKYEIKDSRIKVIPLSSNEGVSLARNVGIDNATGSYIAFADSDDYVDDFFYEKLYKKAVISGADVVKGNIKIVDQLTGAITISVENEKIRENKIHFSVNFTTAIYKRNFLSNHDLRFIPRCLYGEDRLFAASCAVYANDVDTVDDIFYYYYRGNANSADTNFLTKEKVFSYLSGIKWLLGNTHLIDAGIFGTAHIFATFLLDLFRLYRISEYECRETLLVAFFELYSSLPPDCLDVFLTVFIQTEADALCYVKNADIYGLHKYLSDNMTKYSIFLFEQKCLSNKQEHVAPHVSEIPVFLSSDDKFSPFVATTVTSICANTKAFVHFYVLDGGISEKNRAKIVSLKRTFTNFDLEFIKIDTNHIFKDFISLPAITLATYNRLLIPELKQNLKKVIYLDVDIIALGDIATLYNENMDGYSLAAVPEDSYVTASTKKVKQSMELSEDHKYFNAGVLLLDCEKWNSHGITDNLFCIADKYKNQITWQDQDILNKEFDCNYKILDGRYNIMTEAVRKRPVQAGGIIRHFSTVWKPWNYNGVYGSATVANFNDFWQVAAKTPFFLELLTKSEIGKKKTHFVNKVLVAQDSCDALRETICCSSARKECKAVGSSLVSVIIPVYNTERYLRKCLDSILAQNYSALEVICVDDCSPDNSAQILAEYEQKDPRVCMLHHKVNSGAGAARNTGLAAARGQYVYFIDSDDYVDVDYIDSMVFAMEESKAEVVLNTNVIASNTCSQFMDYLLFPGNHVYIPAKQNIQKVIWNTWAHIFKRSFLLENKLMFPSGNAGRVCEDLYFQYIVYAFVERIFVISDSSYHYTVRDDGLTSQELISLRVSEIKWHLGMYKGVLDFYKKNGIFNKYDIKMFSDRCLPEILTPRKTEICSLLREYFLLLVEHVADRWYLYTKCELAFFYGVLKEFDYQHIKAVNKPILSLLRKKLASNKIMHPHPVA
ncbi:MAG: glycosyltransferase [Candidatus Cloacimonetes bacterium]|nr:glycosyltransferase [Candidatus Cloacimonadota bacterium]MDY0230713.1 glycosyltransferase [Candidatus Cloacimonadaceae bacterium]